MVENPYKAPDPKSNPADGNPKKYGILKKILIGLGIFMLLIILLFVWIGIKTASTYNKLEGKAEPLITNVLAEQSPWNYQTLKPKLSKLWIESVDEEQTLKLLKLFAKLGAFKSIEDLSWQGCSTNATTAHGNIDRCDYLVFAKYENGDAYISVGVVMEETEPRIIQLNINSDVFLE